MSRISSKSILKAVAFALAVTTGLAVASGAQAEELSLKGETIGVSAIGTDHYWDLMAFGGIQDQIKALGNVNLDALDEEGTLEAANENLVKQVADLDQARGTLIELIQKLNNVSKERFAGVFTLIQEQFRGGEETERTSASAASGASVDRPACAARTASASSARETSFIR